MSKKGKVYLVGAGPGDPDLITIRGLDVLREADLLVFDALVPVELLNEVKPGCELVDAGKRSGHHQLEQDQIIKLLIRAAKQGRTVVRLKGGDPEIFGRGGEEGEALSRAKISFEIIPGVTSAVAVPAYAGIPLTHRDYNSSVTFLTGHGDNNIDWKSLAAQETVVMLMGVKGLAHNVKALIRHGKDPQTPVAVTQWGTLPQQRTVSGRLDNINERVKMAGLKAPAVVVVGKISKLRSKLDWFERKPLFAKHILVTRSRQQAGEISKRLRVEAARVTEIPTIEIQAPVTWRPLDKALQQIRDFGWVIFTSANGVTAFFERLHQKGGDARTLGRAQIAVIGPATGERLSRYGVQPDVVADSYQAEGLLDKLSDHLLSEQKILIPRAAKARSVLPEQLRKWGADVTVAPCYRSVIPKEARSELKQLLRDDPPDLLTFASSSMVDHFAEILKKDSKLWKQARKIPAACIGPISAASAKQQGLKVLIQPKDYTIPALVDAICRNAKRL